MSRYPNEQLDAEDMDGAAKERRLEAGSSAPICSPPNVVWIQYHGDSDPVEWGPEEPSEVTWSADQVFEHDVEYVRADLVRELLKGHKCSELLGDGGLIAATMRAFEANALEHAPDENQ